MSKFIAETTTGKIQGYAREDHIAFLGIPYAKPPVGELRFKRAVPMEPWEGVFQAKEYGPKATVQ